MTTHTRAIAVTFLCFLTPACQTMKETLTGATVGGLLGAGIAAAMGEDREAILTAAGIGVVTGAFIGNQVALAKEGRRVEEEEKRLAVERAESLRLEQVARVEAARRFEAARLAKAQQDVLRRRQAELDRVAREIEEGKTPAPVADIPDAAAQPVAIVVALPSTPESGDRLGVICDAQTGETLSDNVVVLPDNSNSELDEAKPFVLTVSGPSGEEHRNFTTIYAG